MVLLHCVSVHVGVSICLGLLVVAYDVYISGAVMSARCGAAGPVCKLCVAKRVDCVQWSTARTAGGCHSPLPALPEGHSSWETHPVQDQREDLTLWFGQWLKTDVQNVPMLSLLA